MMRVLWATFVSALSALAVILIAVVALWPFSTYAGKTWEAVAHFCIFGTVVIFPVAFCGAIPLYWFFRAVGFLNWTTVMLGGVALSLVYPLILTFENEMGVVTWPEFGLCALAGAVAAWVFSRMMDIRRVRLDQAET
ncbi:MAG: hypothetical protein JWR07_4281 [Nevskia sp.]|nr:hypothetical protein [Nevskia sp.]